jgi:hypothetical protein
MLRAMPRFTVEKDRVAASFEGLLKRAGIDTRFAAGAAA